MYTNALNNVTLISHFNLTKFTVYYLERNISI